MTESKRTYIITGGNSGLGLHCARNIATTFKDYQIILACRNQQKAEAAVKQLMDETGNQNIYAMELDVSSLASVRNFAAQYLQQGLPKLDGLVCNAGINGMSTGLTGEGFDCVFETNHLGHFLLTNLLLPHIKPNGRIAVVSSDMHSPPGVELDWPGVEALAHPNEKLSKNFVRYSYSKLCNLYFTYELARKLQGINSEIAVNALNPGLMIDTNFAPDKSRFTPEMLEQVKDRIGSLEQSAKALADMVTAPEYEKATSKYIDRGVETLSSPLSYNKENAVELWNRSVQYTGVVVDETLPGLLLA